MKVLRRISYLVVFVTLSLMLTSCFKIKAKEKVFAKAGITVTLDTTFNENENVAFQITYISPTYGFAGNGESKSSLSGIKTLNGYMQAVISSSKKEVDIIEYKENEQISFLYGYYDQIAEGREFTYMVIAKEGKDKFYIFDIWCLKKNFDDKSKSKMMDIAKSITVE